jgi:uncharacterized protein YsxB (DUF464 family)
MIRIRSCPDGDGLLLVAEGHAGYAPCGEDVVCAGVSALLYGFVAYLEGLSPIATAKRDSKGREIPHLAVEEKDGWLRVRTCGMGGLDRAGFAVIEAGLRLVAAAYPAHVTYCGGVG